MIKNSLLEIDKAIVMSSLKDEDINRFIYYMSRYLNTLDEKIQQNSDNKIYIEEKSKSIALFQKKLLYAAKHYFKNEKWVECLNCCRELIKLETKDAQVYKHASFCCRNLKQFDAALKLIEIYAKKVTDDALINLYLGDAYHEIKSVEYGYKAIEYYHKSR